MTKKKIVEQVKYWSEVFQPVNNMGKWFAQTQIDRWKSKLEKHGKHTRTKKHDRR